MAALNFADLAKPVSADEPCGPDPDLDPDLMNVMAQLEVVLPQSYFRRDDEGRQLPFDRGSIDFSAAFADLGKVLKHARDIRGFVMAAKLCLLNRDIAGFAASLGLTIDYLSNYWDEVHPRGEDGDFIMREVALQGLDELATVVLPLQHAPLFTSRRIGPLIFRSQLVATGEVKPTEDEQHPDAGAIATALREAELSDLSAVLAHVGAIRDSLGRLRAIWGERLGAEQAVHFPRLATLVGQIVAFLEEAIGRRAPGAQVAVAPDGAAPAGGGMVVVQSVAPAGSCATVAEAQAALAACLSYFRKVEPSSPAVLLIGQAQRLIGKSLIEVIQIMFPEHVDKAMLEIGAETKYQLPLERLGGDGYGDSSSDEEESSDGSDSGYDDSYGSGEDESPSDDASGEEEGGEGEGEPAADDGQEEAAADVAEAIAEAPPEPEPPKPAKPAPAAAVSVTTRAEAIAQMKAIAGFYRHAEPSNPVPLLMEKACTLAQQDFLSLLGDILPDVGIRQSSDE